MSLIGNVMDESGIEDTSGSLASMKSARCIRSMDVALGNTSRPKERTSQYKYGCRQRSCEKVVSEEHGEAQ